MAIAFDNPFSRRALLLGAIPCLSSCTAVGTFNALVAVDEGAARVAANLAYGALDRQSLDIYAPPGAKALPTVLFIYGGSWSSGERADYAFAGQALASRGFVAAIADYRLVPQVAYPEFLNDGALALKWLQDHAGAYGGDSRRLFVMGHSAGAYNAVMLALDGQLARKANVDRSRIKGGIGLAGPYDFLPLDDPATINAFGRWPELAQTQPVNHVTAAAPPMFLAHGEADTTVFPRNTRSLAARLRAAGRSVEEHIYPGISHAGILTALSRPFRSSAPVLDDVERFIRTHA